MEGNFEDGGTFNYAFKYLERIHDIEVHLNQSLLTDDYDSIYRLLNILWSELTEWMNEEEEQQHHLLRQEVRQVHQQIKKARSLNKKTVPTAWIDIYWKWLTTLKKFKHKKGLTMPSKADPGTALAGKHY